MFTKIFDIIAFGSAARDINLVSKDFNVVKGVPEQEGDFKDFVTGEGICLALGSKININEIRYTSGGGGTNVAATFAKQGLKTAFCGAIGTDEAGLHIIKELKAWGVDLRLLQKRKEKMTNHSVVISNGSKDRIILAYRGAAELMGKDDIPFNKLKTKWIYLAPLTGLLCENFERIVDFAYAQGIKVAVNPSKQQLSLPAEQLARIFKKVDILFLNKEEASFLTKISFNQEAEIFKKIDEMCPGIAVMTKGGNGVVASDGKHIYAAEPNPERVIIDTTGAGDAFASGFVTEFIRSKGNIEKAIQFGMGNSEGNLRAVGAKTGLLAKGEAFYRVPVTKQECDNGVCLVK